MQYGQVERELMDGEPWSFSHPTQLPHHLHPREFSERGIEDINEEIVIFEQRRLAHKVNLRQLILSLLWG